LLEVVGYRLTLGLSLNFVGLSPNFLSLSTNFVGLSTNFADLSPTLGLSLNVGDLSPNFLSLSPNFADLSPNFLGLSPNIEFIAQRCGLSPNFLGLSPNFLDLSPNILGLSPNFRDLSPTVSNLSIFIFKTNTPHHKKMRGSNLHNIHIQNPPSYPRRLQRVFYKGRSPGLCFIRFFMPSRYFQWRRLKKLTHTVAGPHRNYTDFPFHFT